MKLAYIPENSDNYFIGEFKVDRWCGWPIDEYNMETLIVGLGAWFDKKTNKSQRRRKEQLHCVTFSIEKFIMETQLFEVGKNNQLTII